jgi:hypothetical protein
VKKETIKIINYTAAEYVQTVQTVSIIPKSKLFERKCEIIGYASLYGFQYYVV